ncbi:ATP-binding protein [Paraburkholderia sp. BL17N1]|uniref:ATP-binding protein n=1 Tax=Paraburkholderia sp. BL17N1 TaxID=1938798 RepID=UPI000EB37229|nr:ATP-binding protein [Paraburkholderia sp. BL17N1]RKR43612.1 histidine kinase/DNA gyrase B/HSP90-like ATPase [Paraburkholderia sp. BL17N1]
MTTTDFDLTPDPRVLQILGEINLDQWKCLAELIDNSVDAFINARRDGVHVESPSVVISLPTQDKEDASVAVRDNGPGMNLEQLERAVRAGWSGNNPLDNLGLFGMGFNIATARLGMVTEVYTTRAGDKEWTGLRIDLDELRRTRTYQTPRLTRPKHDPSAHGTEIKILRLKTDQRVYFSKSANHNRIRRQLARVYAPLLLSNDAAFSLQINSQNVQAKRPCHWDPDRAVLGSTGTPVHAVETFDFELPARHYCLTCMLSFSGDHGCPTAGTECKTVELKRRLHGWIGLQRYMHEEDFGLDIIRNGRVIEVQNKDLFVWAGGERPEREYPIDDQRNRGRFIGEIHLDHCRVSYTKDRFERDDTSWAEMVSLVRGEGPLQPQKAKALGFEPQDAPLYRLFQAFRRSSPQGKTGRWSRILAVKNNERAIEMADLFHKGDAEYQTDEKWYDLVAEEDRGIVGAAISTSSGSAPPAVPDGFLDDDDLADPNGTVVLPSIPFDSAPTIPLVPTRQKLHDLSRVYKHPLLKVEFTVEAFMVASNDPDLPRKAPWTLKIEDPGTRTFLFLFDPDHPVFRSVTMTPMDAILAELAFKTYEFLREASPHSAVFATIVSDLRGEYAEDAKLDPKSIIAFADKTLREIAQSISIGGDAYFFKALFTELPQTAQERIRRKIASTGVSGAQAVIDSGEFLSYAEASDIRSFVKCHPELFFDGKFWAQPYSSLEYGDSKVDEEARGRVVERYDAYLADAVWLESQTPRDLDRCDRDELIRATLSVRLLGQDGSL